MFTGEKTIIETKYTKKKNMKKIEKKTETFQKYFHIFVYLNCLPRGSIRHGEGSMFKTTGK